MIHKYWKEYSGTGSYYMIVSEGQVVEVNIEVGIILHSEVRDKLIPVAKQGLGSEDFVPVAEEDFDLYFDLVIDKLKITTK